MKIELLNNGGKRWEKFNENFIKGFAFINNRLLQKQDLADEIISSIKQDNLNQFLNKLNGNFSCIIKKDDSLYLIADKMKSYPLLYMNLNGKWIVCDQANTILNLHENISINENSVITYVALGYLHGNKTLIDGCKIVSSGTYVILQNSSTEFRYHKHIYKKTQPNDVSRLLDLAEKNMEDAIKRMMISIGDRPIWIPLSGGYDSRLLACVLKKMNIANVNCFTYGALSSYEVKISRQVANTLGFPWHFVEYTDSNISQIPYETDYFRRAMNLNSTAHYQDFVAINELKNKGIIQKNAVIIPGHSGEILGRDQVPYELLDKKKSVADLLYFRYYNRNELKNKYKKIAKSDLGDELNNLIVNTNKNLAIDLFNNWNVQNRQSNFIVNAVRVYEHFNLDWRIPLWDDELSLFWFSISCEINKNVEFYNKFMFEKYFIPFNVAIYKESYASGNIISRIRLPFGIKYKLKYYITKYSSFLKGVYDFNNLNIITDVIDRQLKSFNPRYIKAKHRYSDSLDTLFQLYLITKKDDKYKKTY